MSELFSTGEIALEWGVTQQTVNYRMRTYVGNPAQEANGVHPAKWSREQMALAMSNVKLQYASRGGYKRKLSFDDGHCQTCGLILVDDPTHAWYGTNARCGDLCVGCHGGDVVERELVTGASAQRARVPYLAVGK